ncbi:MAG: 2-oxoglutarate ferredoxin oxidoreductase subunit alpha [candidate division Zixibacteria bacterium SM23_81]|nr:MAG: 2-oxoglutarate ferredoxin oxidoreductase subunit alpha [candidate division Zixibacteria bacterium SM23_81]
MKADPKGVLTGSHFLDGDHACAEGALAAGCRFFGGYPITPSTEVAERFSQRCPLVEAIFIQMEDELGSLAAVIGAAWTGRKAMTVTSGPGFSLMMEHIGLAAMLETPLVLANVQRGGPSTGLPTLTGQADMMQARWGSHGDYEIIAVSPNSPQETFDFTIKAFNLSERYRVPVLVMLDECVGHMTEKVVIPPADEIEIEPRRYYKGPKDKYLPFKPDKDLVPPMVDAGSGTRFHVTGLTHDYRGYPVMSADCQEELVRRLVNKIRKNADHIVEYEEEQTDGADVVVISYGITSRVALRAVDLARQEGIKVGILRLIVVWPFPEKRIRELAGKVKAFVMPEINYGQMVLEVDRCACGRAEVALVPHGGGWVHDPEDILHTIRQAAKGKGVGKGVIEYPRKKRG